MKNRRQLLKKIARLATLSFTWPLNSYGAMNFGFWKGKPPVVPGSTTYSSPGSVSFSVPSHNNLIIELVGGGGEASANSDGNAGGSTTWDGGSGSGKPEAGGGGGGYSSKGKGSGSGDYFGDGGVAVNGDINTAGSDGEESVSKKSNGFGGDAAAPLGGSGATSSNGNGSAPGGGGASSTTLSTGGGGGGSYCKKSYTSGTYSNGASVTVFVGEGGNGGSTGGDGGDGRAVITWN